MTNTNTQNKAPALQAVQAAPLSSYDRAAAERHALRVQLLSGALKLWVTSAEHPERMVNLQSVVADQTQGVFEFLAELMAANAVPVAPQITQHAFIVGAVLGYTYAQIANALDFSTGYVSKTMSAAGDSCEAVRETYKPHVTRAFALFGAAVNDPVDAETATQELSEMPDAPEGVTITALEGLPQGEARIADPGHPTPRLQTPEDMQ